MKTLLRICRYIGYLLFRPIWILERLVPRSNTIWIFGAWYGQKFSDNSKWLYEYVLNNYKSIKPIWITKNKEIYNELRKQNKNVYLSKSFFGIYYSLRAKWCFLSSGTVDINRYFINGAKIILLWHGMPLKKIGFSDDTQITSLKKLKLLEFFNPYIYTTLHPYATLSSAPFFNNFLIDAFRVSDSQIWQVGLPRCDAFFSEMNEPFITKIKEKNPTAKIMIYLPTYRMSSDGLGKCFSPFEQKFGFNNLEFQSFLEENNIIILYKPHYMDSVVDIGLSTKNFIRINDSDFNDLYILLNNVDALITDYSSVYFDFLPSKKSVFLCPFDYKEYLSTSRGHYFNMYEEMDAVVCNSWQDFYKKAASMPWETVKETEIQKFATYLDGNVCEKIVRKISEIIQNEEASQIITT